MSLIASLLLVVKMSYTVYGFKRPATQEEEELSIFQKIKKIPKTVLTNMQMALPLIPSLLTAIFFNIGTITLAITVLRWTSTVFFIILFISNVIILYIVPFEYIEMFFKNTGLGKHFPQIKTYPKVPKGKLVDFFPKVKTYPRKQTNWHPLIHGMQINTSLQNALFMSWSNILFVSRQVTEPSFQISACMVLLQINKFCFNVILLLIIIVMYPSAALGVQILFILMFGILHMFLALCCGDKVMITCRQETDNLHGEQKSGLYRFSTAMDSQESEA